MWLKMNTTTMTPCHITANPVRVGRKLPVIVLASLAGTVSRAVRHIDYGPFRIANSGDIRVARHAGRKDAANATAATIAVE